MLSAAKPCAASYLDFYYQGPAGGLTRFSAAGSGAAGNQDFMLRFGVVTPARNLMTYLAHHLADRHPWLDLAIWFAGALAFSFPFGAQFILG